MRTLLALRAGRTTREPRYPHTRISEALWHMCLEHDLLRDIQSAIGAARAALSSHPAYDTEGHQGTLRSISLAIFGTLPYITGGNDAKQLLKKERDAAVARYKELLGDKPVNIQPAKTKVKHL
jgi:hypothetical protein